MKAFILTEGGLVLGLGHLTRCLSLYQEFKRKGIHPEVIINGDETIEGIVRCERYCILDWVKNQEKMFDVIRGADIVVIDSYLADKTIYKTISDAAKVPVFLDDTNRLSYPKGIVVNSLICAEDFCYPGNEGRVYLLGVDYVCLRDAFLSFGGKNIRRKIKNVLVTCGGINHYDWVKSVTEYLSKEFSVTVNIIGANGARADAGIMMKAMVEADVCVTGGGQTIHELARCGVPAIGICFAENQLVNLRKWAQTGFVEFVGKYNDDGIVQKIGKTLSMCDFQKRKRMSMIGRQYIDDNGARRIVEKILAYAKN